MDIIRCFCPEDGIVLDPYMGCGSTAVSAVKLDRHFIGFDISQEYVDLAYQRLWVDANYQQLSMF